MGQYDAILPTVTDRLPAAVFDQIGNAHEVLANYGVGFAHIDTEAAKARGIAVTNTPDVLSECTADIAMTLMLMVARRAGRASANCARAAGPAGARPI
jgi:glyoxylate reductase